MPSTVMNTDAEFYTMLYAMYKRGVSQITVAEDIWDNISDSKSDTFRKIIDGVNLSLDNHTDRKLQMYPRGEEVRMRIMYALGLRPKEASDVCQNINVVPWSHQSDIMLGKVFSSGGSLNTIGRISLEDATYISPLLETPCSVLVSESGVRCAPSQEAGWFRHLPHINPHELQLPKNYPSSSIQCRTEYSTINRRNGRSDKLGRGMHCGQYYIEDLDITVGLHILYLPDFVQVVLHVDEAVHVARAKWVHRLVAIGSDIGIAGPYVYSLSVPFLSRGNTQIHRISWLLNRGKSLQGRLRLFTRVFSPRTAEVSISNGRDLSTFSFPLAKQHAIMPELLRMGIFS